MRLYLTCQYKLQQITLFFFYIYCMTLSRQCDWSLPTQMEGTLLCICVELHDDGCAIRFRALEFTLHPDAVHL
jgi:hypothetical protein